MSAKVSKKVEKNVKNKKTANVTVNDSDNEVKKLVILVAVIIAILAIIYVVTTLIKGKDYSNIFDNNLDVSEIQTDEILVGNMLKQSPEEYYVLVFDDTDDNYSTYNNYLTTYIGLEYTTRIYSVDLNNIFNKSAKSEEASYVNGDLRFTGSTLVKVNNGEIVDVHTDATEIETIILDLTKEIDSN